MVDVVDDTIEMVAASVKLEGKAEIVIITVNGTEVYPTANTVSLHEGDAVAVSSTIRNVGDVSDTLFLTLTNVNTGAVIGREAIPMNVNTLFEYGFLSMTMPATDLTLKVEAGHVE